MARKKPKAKKPKAKKPKAKKAKKPAPNVQRAFEKIGKGPPKPTNSAELASLAMAGDVEALVVRLQPFGGDGENDTLAYKWLEVASDFGPTAKHRKAADDLIDDLLQSSMLRYDDDQIGTGGAHWELAIAYLTGKRGLPRDLERASAQLAMAKERFYPWSLQGAAQLIATTRKALEADARATFDAIYDGTKPE